MKPLRYRHYVTTVFISVIYLSGIFAQEKSDMDTRNRSLKFGYSRISNWTLEDGNFGEFTVEVNCGLKKYLDIGVYAGWSLTETEMKEDNETSFNNTSVVSYGVNSYFYLMPLITGKRFRLDVSLILKPGGFFVLSKTNYSPKGHYFTFRPGIGVNYRIFRGTSIFAEYLYGLGDGKYRAIKGWPDNEIGYKNHIGSFRFGVAFYW